MRSGIEEHPFSGDCLGALGIPDHGTVLIDFDAEPRVFDIVFCDSPLGTVHGFMKQLLQTGDHALVTTQYKDPKRNFLFHAASIMGVAIEFRNDKGEVVWRRPHKTEGDKVRAMNDEELAGILSLPSLADPPWCSIDAGCRYLNHDPVRCDLCALDWLRQEVEE